MDYRLDYVRFKLWHWQCLRCISFRHLNANSNPYTQWIRDDGDYNEHSEVVFTFPIAFSTCFWAGALGWANNRYGGSYQSGGVKWFNNTQFAHVGADNGSCSMLVLALGI